MTLSEQKFLLALLNLSKKLPQNDGTVMNDVTVMNSNMFLLEANKIQIEDIMRAQCEMATVTNKDLVANVVNAFAFLDKAFLLETIKFSVIDQNDRDMLKSLIEQSLSKVIVFVNKTNEFYYYSKMVNMCIGIKDPELIEKAILKVQNLRIS